MGDRSTSSAASSSTERGGAAYQPTLTDAHRLAPLEKPQLTMKDLVSFAYQTARGMDYLSTRMVTSTTHGGTVTLA